MKLALLAPRSVIHTVRWANEMARRGHDVHLISMHRGGDYLDPAVQVHLLPFPAPMGYYLNAFHLRQLLRRLRPALLHAHYASGYGTLGRLSCYHPYILSVWGADVYDFPRQSGLAFRILRSNLRAADWLCSTSHVMAKQTLQLCPGLTNLSVIPFGVDVVQFCPRQGRSDTSTITVGAVKTLAPKYGIDVLIRAFAVARRALMGLAPDLGASLRLLIVGGGRDRASLEALAKEQGLSDVAVFAGQVMHSEVPGFLNRLDVYVAASRKDSESFGVAVIEASAAGVPVVVSNVGGLPEVVLDGVTGLVVEPEDVPATANAILRLVMDSSLRRRMGAAGRQHVLARYQWSESAALMDQVYARMLRRNEAEGLCQR